jgi:hypothetical protein
VLVEIAAIEYVSENIRVSAVVPGPIATPMISAGSLQQRRGHPPFPCERPTSLRVDWRFISLSLINSHVDYDAHFPAGYEAGHTAGLRLLRVAARVRAQHGRDAIGRSTPRSAPVPSRLLPYLTNAIRVSTAPQNPSQPSWPTPAYPLSSLLPSMTTASMPNSAPRPTRRSA